MLDNITSCNVVDNFLLLDEYEQNLIKEGEGAVGGAEGLRSRIRKWSLVRQPSGGVGAQARLGGPQGARVGGRPAPGRPLLPFLARRTITTIGEEKEEVVVEGLPS